MMLELRLISSSSASRIPADKNTLWFSENAAAHRLLSQTAVALPKGNVGKSVLLYDITGDSPQNREEVSKLLFPGKIVVIPSLVVEQVVRTEKDSVPPGKVSFTTIRESTIEQDSGRVLDVRIGIRGKNTPSTKVGAGRRIWADESEPRTTKTATMRAFILCMSWQLFRILRLEGPDLLTTSCRYCWRRMMERWVEQEFEWGRWSFIADCGEQCPPYGRIHKHYDQVHGTDESRAVFSFDYPRVHWPAVECQCGWWDVRDTVALGNNDLRKVQ